MSIDDFLDDLEDIGEELNEIDSFLLEIAGPIVDRMKSSAPIDTGALKRSIRAEVSNNTLTFKMLNYGAFQNYGVRGKQDTKGKPVPFGLDPQPSSGDIFKFKKRRFGITQRNFFDIEDISDEVLEKLAQKIIK